MIEHKIHFCIARIFFSLNLLALNSISFKFQHQFNILLWWNAWLKMFSHDIVFSYLLTLLVNLHGGPPNKVLSRKNVDNIKYFSKHGNVWELFCQYCWKPFKPFHYYGLKTFKWKWYKYQSVFYNLKSKLKLIKECSQTS